MIHYYRRLGIVLFVFLFSLSAPAQKGQELLDEISASGAYLPDFSYAGYHSGEKSPTIPANAIILKAIDHNITPNDKNDDSKAFIALLKKANTINGPVVIQLPVGRIIISEILYFERSNIILNGAGTGKYGSEIYCPRPMIYLEDPKDLQELREYLVQLNKYQKEPEKNIKLRFSQYSWTGGFLWTRVPGARVKSYLKKYDVKPKVLAKVTKATRGAFSFKVNKTNNLKIGDVITLQSFNKEGEKGALISELYGTDTLKVGGHHYNYPNLPYVRQQVKITAIKKNLVTTATPILINIKPEFKSELIRWDHLEEVGFQNFKITFPYAEKVAHHIEQGFNAFYLTRIYNSWIKNIVIENADSGILDESIANVTIEDIVTKGDKYAHYSVQLGGVHNVLVKNLSVQNLAMHPLSFNTFCSKSVYTDCEVLQSPILDQHSGANHQNLFDNIKVYINPNTERSYPLFEGGGAPYWKPSHGSFSTFWNIKIHFLSQLDNDQSILLNGMNDGYNARVFGVHGNKPIRIEYGPNALIKGTNKSFDRIPSLYYQQLLNRQKKRNYSLVNHF